MGWILQSAFQAAIVGLLTLGVFRSSSFSIQLFCAAFLIWFVITIGRNPLLFWQRIARFIIVTSLPFLVAGINFRVSGSARAPGDFGHIIFQIEQTSGGHLWIVVIIFLGSAAMDGLLMFRQSTQRSKLVADDGTDRADLSIEPKEELEIVYRPVIEAPERGASLRGAQIRIRGLWPKTFKCIIYPPPDDKGMQHPIQTDIPLELESHERKALRITTTVKRGLYQKWLQARATWPLLSLVPLRAEYLLIGAPSSVRQPLPVSIATVS